MNLDFDSNELWTWNFNDAFNDIVNHRYTDYCFKGGRGSCKSSFVSICIIILIVLFPDINAVILRKYKDTLRTSVFEQMQWAISKLGLDDKFKCTVSPMVITYLPTGQLIHFRGCDNPTKIKSIKVKKGYIGIVWFEESSEFSPADIRSVKQSAERGGTKFWIFDSYNPPVSARNWKNADALISNPNRLMHTSDYRTVPSEWLSEAFIYDAEHLLKTNKRLYDNEYLGIATGTGLNVFENITIRKITQNEIDNFDWKYRGIDWGYFPDPFMFVEMSYSVKTKTLYIYDELQLRKHGNLQASEKLKEHLTAKHGDNYNNIQITGDNTDKDINDFRSYGWDIRSAIKGGNSVENGFKWLQSLDAIIIDNERCPNASKEFTEYEYEQDRNGNILTGYPQGQEDHAMACVRYALECIWRKRGL